MASLECIQRYGNVALRKQTGTFTLCDVQRMRSHSTENRYRCTGTRNHDLWNTATSHIVIHYGACAVYFATCDKLASKGRVSTILPYICIANGWFHVKHIFTAWRDWLVDGHSSIFICIYFLQFIFSYKSNFVHVCNFFILFFF